MTHRRGPCGEIPVAGRVGREVPVVITVLAPVYTRILVISVVVKRVKEPFPSVVPVIAPHAGPTGALVEPVPTLGGRGVRPPPPHGAGVVVTPGIVFPCPSTGRIDSCRVRGMGRGVAGGVMPRSLRRVDRDIRQSVVHCRVKDNPVFQRLEDYFAAQGLPKHRCAFHLLLPP